MGYPSSPWSLWPRPDTDVFGEETYSANFLFKVDLPIVLGILAIFFLPAVREWTGCNPWIILAGFAVHVATFAAVVGVGFRRVPPAPRELLTHCANLLATVSIPLSTTRPLFILWVLYFLVVWFDAFGNPKSVASFAVSVLAPFISGLWHFSGPEGSGKVIMAMLSALLGGVIYLLAASLADWARKGALAKAERARVKGVRDERARIGRTMDATLGSALSEIALWHEVARAGGAAAGQADAIAMAQARAREALVNLRALVAGIDGEPAEMRGLSAEVRRRAANQCEAAGVLFELSVGGPGPLTQGDAYNMAKIAIEGVTNAVRHGRPRRVCVFLSASPLIVKVEDDGDGFDPSNAPEGRGLSQISDYAEALGGTLLLESRPGSGTVLTVRASSHEP